MITDWSIRHGVTVFVLAMMVLLGGVFAYGTLPRESFPEIEVPLIIVSTVYEGVAPADIESQITRKIETEVKEIPGLDELRSTSSEGVSSIFIEFSPDVDLQDALQRVREKVDLARPELPPDAEDPAILDVDFSQFPILLVGLGGDFGLVRLKEIAEDLKDELEGIPGINEVEVIGGREREVHVFADPVRLAERELGLDDLVEAVRKEHLTLPGGEIDVGRRKYLVRVPGEVVEPREIENFVVKVHEDRPVYLRDVARVVYGFEDENTRSRLNGRPSITLAVKKRTGANIIEVADAVKQAVDEQRPALPAGLEVSYQGDQSKDIRSMVRELENNILSGLILVVGVLFLFLGFRNSLFVAVALPLSMLISFAVLQLLGYTLNMVILFSLILVLGMLVDNAIVIVENIFRHREEGETGMVAASRGTREVAAPVIASTLTTICAFAPMLFWPGIIGDFMKYLPITLIVALSASLAVALVFNPTFCATMMTVSRRGSRGPGRHEGRFLGGYRILLAWVLGHRAVVLLVMFVLLAGSALAYSWLGRGVEFFPEIEPRQVWVDVKTPTGSRLATTDAVVRGIESRVSDTVDLKDYVSSVGSTGETFDFGSGSSGTPDLARVTLDLEEQQERAQSSFVTLEQIREAVSDVGGARIDVDRPVEGPPTGKPVSIELAGRDLDVLGRLSREIQARIRTVPGLVNLDDDYDEGKPELRVRVDREAAAVSNVSTRRIADILRTAISGTEAAQFRVGEDEYDILVRLPPEQRSSIDALANLTIPDEDGIPVPLRDIVRLERGLGPTAIHRLDLKRVVTLEADVVRAPGRTDAAVRAEVARRLGEMSFPSGYRWSFGGSNEEEEETKAFLSRVFVVALLLIGLILVTQFNSLILPLTIMVSVLLSVIGVFWGLIVTGTPFGIVMTGIGVISLAGVVVNNAIVMCDFIKQLMHRGMTRTEAAIEAGVLRLRPVLLTAVTTILGLIPLTLGLSFDFFTGDWTVGGESSQWWGPMGVAVIFGLGFATVLTLVVVPVTFHGLDQFSTWLRGVRSGSSPADGSGSGA